MAESLYHKLLGNNLELRSVILKNHFFNAQLDEFVEGCRGINKIEIMKTGTRSMDTTQLLNQRAISCIPKSFLCTTFLKESSTTYILFFSVGNNRKKFSLFLLFLLRCTHWGSLFKFLIYSHDTACN